MGSKENRQDLVRMYGLELLIGKNGNEKIYFLMVKYMMLGLMMTKLSVLGNSFGVMGKRIRVDGRMVKCISKNYLIDQVDPHIK